MSRLPRGCRATRWWKMLAFVALGLASGPISHCAAGEAAREVHGSSDVFAVAGVAIAWAVLRDANEADAMVVMRISRDAAMHPACAVTGVDPFSGQSQAILAPTVGRETLDVRMLRRRFADFPRTEVKLYASAKAAVNEPPALTIFYLGVPDTAPEFTSERTLRTYLDERIARLRSNPGGKTP